MRSRRTIFVLVLSVVVLLLSAIPGRATFPKLYTLNVAPANVTSGAEQTFTVTYQGKSQFGVGSSNLSVPAEFTGVSIVSFVAPKGTATAVGNTIQLRGMNLGMNKRAVLTLKATVPCGPATYTWSAITKSSSSFSGGADFTLTSPSSLTTTAAGNCPPAALRFVEGHTPSDAEKNAVITNTPLDPSGPSVQVEALDQNGQRATSFTGHVSLSENGPGAIVGSTGEADAVAGVAEFPALAIDAAGDYQLTATSGSVSAQSNVFTIFGAVIECGAPPTHFDAGGNAVSVAAPDVPGCEATPVNVEILDDGSVELSKPEVDADAILTMTIVWVVENAENPLHATTIDYGSGPHIMVFCNADANDDGVPDVPTPATEPWCIGSQTVVPVGIPGNVQLTESYVGQGDPRFKR